MVARKLTPAHRILVASPDYLAKRLPVHVPEDLGLCNGILIRSPQTGRVRTWQLTNRAREQRPFDAQAAHDHGRLRSRVLRLHQGLGIALVSMPMAVPFLDSGAVVRVLPDWYVDDGNISLYYAEHKLLPGKTRVFVDFILEQFAEQRLAATVQRGIALTAELAARQCSKLIRANGACDCRDRSCPYHALYSCLPAWR